MSLPDLSGLGLTPEEERIEMARIRAELAKNTPPRQPRSEPLRGRGTGHNLAKILGDVAGKAAQDGGTRLTSAIDGSDPSDASYDTTGGSVNRISKAQRWTGFVQKDLGLQKVQYAIMNKVANGITYGGSVNRLNKAQRWTGYVQKDLGLQRIQDALMNKAASNITYGFGLKKRVVKRKPRKISGRALFNA